jgi:hypothetical protein
MALYVVVGWIWTFFLATAVHVVLIRAQNARIAESDEAHIAATSGTDPSFAAVVTFFLGITAPFFLYQARGWRGALLGVALVLMAGVGSAATNVGLMLLRGY